jgi:protein TonB
MGAGLVAWNPKDLEHIEPFKPKPIAVKLPDPPRTEEPPPPPPDQPTQADLLAQLAPESFSSMQDLGGGVGFGNGGNGPSIGGGGGFGGDANTLVGQKTSVDRPPRAVLKSAPEFPQEARSRGVSGFVELKILVGLNGSIESIEVEKSEPAGFFDQAAMQAVRQWRFEPGITKGQAVAAWTTQRIKFELN